MRSLTVAGGVLVLAVSLLRAQPSVTTLPFFAEGVSADGRVAFGSTDDRAMGHAVYWTRSGGMVDLGISPAKVTSASADGSALTMTNGSGHVRSWFWSQGAGIVEVFVPGMDAVQASCISRDGLVVSGAALPPGVQPYHGYVWSPGGGSHVIPEGVNYASWVHAVSPTGLKAVGSGSSGLGTWPMIWRSTYLWCESLGPVAGYNNGVAYAATPDVETVVGSLGDSITYNAFVWTATQGLAVFPLLPGSVSATLQAVSDDGSIAAGYQTNSNGRTGLIWRRGAGLIPADAYFAAHGLTTHTTEIMGMSANGRVFCDVHALIDLGSCGSADFNHDGSAGTDSDIEDFFRCLAGDCCPMCDSADFNYDGDAATDADIEAFFRVLAGGSC